MDTKELAKIRAGIGVTQAVMAELLRCDEVGYRRYESGGRPIPQYIQRSVKHVEFLHKERIYKKFEKFLLAS